MSVAVNFTDGRFVAVREGETLLEACRRSAVRITFSCGAGVCHSCLLRADHGAVPPAAQRGLPARLRQRNYLLACLCEPREALVCSEPDPLDRQERALVHDAAPAGRFVFLRFETERELPWQPGDRLMLLSPVGAECHITAANPDCVFEALCEADADAAAVLRALAFGTDISLCGPVDEAGGDELAQPPPDPQLWRELGDGAVVEAVLRDFYERVYAHERLAPFFAGITRERSIEKQFSFLKQLMTGDRVYFGDRPRNAHHWMVIPSELFELRQALMRERLVAHGLTESQVARWTRFEVHYRRDIVKSAPWPRRIGGIDVPLEGYGEEVLSEGTVCDHCGSALSPGVRVKYHVRLGTVSGPCCAGAAH